MKFQAVWFEINELIHDAVELLRPITEQKTTQIFFESKQNRLVFADKVMINTILQNLVFNAIKYTNQGGYIRILIEEQSNEWIISVHGNGVGIKGEANEKLFWIDTSYSTVGTQIEQGTGLGLILCKEFVDIHQGKICRK